MTAIPRKAVRVPIDGVVLDADLVVPKRARGLVIFAHGSGSSRHSPRNRRVARAFNDRGFATLLADLLTPEEAQFDERSGELRFDINLLGTRVGVLVDWASTVPELRDLSIGLYGASTGAAAALVAAAAKPDLVRAVVSRGGRPDLAHDELGKVSAPTLLIVGARDGQVIELNRSAESRMHCESQLVIVPGATHLFEEPGALEKVTQLATSWFDRHLAPALPAPDHTPSRSPLADEWLQDPSIVNGYTDRHHAGSVLARHVVAIVGDLVDPIVVGIPRGGVVVADEVARRLGAPLTTIVVRKIGAPNQPELAIGAVDEEGAIVLGSHARGVLPTQIDALARRAVAEAHQRAITLRSGHEPPVVDGRDVIVVDDGYATGMTALATARYLHRHGARRVVLVVPVGPRSLLQTPPDAFDQVICPHAPRDFRAVGLHYHNFDQVSDDEVRRLLANNAHTPSEPVRR